MLLKPPECFDCPLHGDGQGFSAVEGLGTFGVHLVGESLWEAEERDGLPFRPDAPAGSVLERAIRMAGYSRDQFTIHNVCRCRPPSLGFFDDPKSGGDADKAIRHCRAHFQKVCDAHPPRAILALGNTALRALTGLSGEKLGVTDLRGYVLDSEYGLVIPTYHPSYLRRGSSKSRDEEMGGGRTKATTGAGMALLGTLVHDLQRAVRVAAGVDRSFILHPEFSDYFDRYQERPSLDDARTFLQKVQESPEVLLAYDLEHPLDVVEEPDDEENEVLSASLLAAHNMLGAGRVIYSVQFSLAPGSGIYLPWEGAYIDVARQIFALLNPKAGSFNRKNDDPRLASWGIRPAGRIYDLWEAFHHLQPDVPARLQSIASYMYYSLVRGRGLYAPFPFPWKHMRSAEPERYGIIDVDVVQIMLPRLHEEIKRTGLWRGYEQVCGLNIDVFPGMTRRGIPVSKDQHRLLRAAFEEEVASQEAQVRAICPDGARTVHNPEGYERPPAHVRLALIADPAVARVEGPGGETYVKTEAETLPFLSRGKDNAPGCIFDGPASASSGKDANPPGKRRRTRNLGRPTLGKKCATETFDSNLAAASNRGGPRAASAEEPSERR